MTRALIPLRGREGIKIIIKNDPEGKNQK